MSRAEAGATGRPQQASPPAVEGPVVAVDPAAPIEPAEPAEVVVESRPPWAGWEPIVRVAGVLIAVVAIVLSGALELLLTPLRAGDLSTVWRGAAIGSGGGPVLGLSILLAVVANYAIAWFAVSTTRRRWTVAPPWVLWTLIMMFAAGVRTDEGDYLLGGNDWVALVMILAGSMSFAVYSYRMILKRLAPPK
jgi:hypothetical protein